MSTEPVRPRRSMGEEPVDQEDASSSELPLSGSARRRMPELEDAESREPQLGQSPPVAAPPPRRALSPQRHSAPCGRRIKPWMVALGVGAAFTALVLVLYPGQGPAPKTEQTPQGVVSPTLGPADQPGSTGPANDTSPGGSVSPSPTGMPSVAAGPAVVQLDDAGFTLPEGWELYTDEVVDDSRRLVRIREPLSDVRAQLVSLISIGDDLNAACQALVDDQSGAYSQVVPVLPSAIGLSSAEGMGVTCGFRVVRTSDQQHNNVTFTLLRRASDGHSLVLRSTVPSSVNTDSAPHAAFFGIDCEASSSFGVPLPLC